VVNDNDYVEVEDAEIIQEAENGNKKCFEMKRGEFAAEESAKTLINYPLMIRYHAADGGIFSASYRSTIFLTLVSLRFCAIDNLIYPLITSIFRQLSAAVRYRKLFACKRPIKPREMIKTIISFPFKCHIESRNYKQHKSFSPGQFNWYCW
jgi:hypothetical protein